ncbi:hypothetical protein ACSEE7_19955 [Halomonas cupida]|uniref:hypothetical protein n=1 Tax=Halomonas cupida TaxID=44933 RepID=UPI003EF4535F|tara:strand:+ start:6766 stop:7011 length:246 start_codon:yes stop_codon:yes gene_type:complete
MALPILHSLYVVATLSTRDVPMSQWMPISTQTYPVQHVADREAEKMALRARHHEQVAGLEYTAEGARLVGRIHHGGNVCQP